MSVLVKGMEMPEDGRYIVCITHDSEGGVHWVFQNQDTLKFLKHSGVTEVPPHGRLIDADALCEGRVRNDNVVICAKCAPTVIPAEEGE